MQLTSFLGKYSTCSISFARWAHTVFSIPFHWKQNAMRSIYLHLAQCVCTVFVSTRNRAHCLRSEQHSSPLGLYNMCSILLCWCPAFPLLRWMCLLSEHTCPSLKEIVLLGIAIFISCLCWCYLPVFCTWKRKFSCCLVKLLLTWNLSLSDILFDIHSYERERYYLSHTFWHSISLVLNTVVTSTVLLAAVRIADQLLMLKQ